MRHKAHNQSSIVQILLTNKNWNFVREGTYLIFLILLILDKNWVF